MKSFTTVLAILAFSCATPPPAAEPEETPAAVKLSDEQKANVDRIIGAPGGYDEAEETYKVTFPRSEVAVMIDGRAFHPSQGMTSWAAFTPTGPGEVMVMGDLTLFEDEVNPVMSAALENGLEVTALHNHFFYDRPKVMFMHIGGHGGIDALASGVRKAVDTVAAIRRAAPQPAAGFAGAEIPTENSITAEPIDQVLGHSGGVNNGIYKVTIGRKATMHGHVFGAQMGVNTWATFAGSDAAAVVDGDFAMHEDEVQAVLKALRGAGINVVALHNHMIHDEPRFVFLHYWGKGPTVELARGLRTALDHLKD